MTLPPPFHDVGDLGRVGTAQLPPDVWHQLSVEFSTGAGATTRVSVDGVVVKEFASAELAGPMDRLSISTRRAGRVVDLWFDDVCAASDARR